MFFTQEAGGSVLTAVNAPTSDQLSLTIPPRMSCYSLYLRNKKIRRMECKVKLDIEYVHFCFKSNFKFSSDSFASLHAPASVFFLLA